MRRNCLKRIYRLSQLLPLVYCIPVVARSRFCESLKSVLLGCSNQSIANNIMEMKTRIPSKLVQVGYPLFGGTPRRLRSTVRVSFRCFSPANQIDQILMSRFANNRRRNQVDFRSKIDEKCLMEFQRRFRVENRQEISWSEIDVISKVDLVCLESTMKLLS